MQSLYDVMNRAPAPKKVLYSMIMPGGAYLGRIVRHSTEKRYTHAWVYLHDNAQIGWAIGGLCWSESAARTQAKQYAEETGRDTGCVTVTIC